MKKMEVVRWKKNVKTYVVDEEKKEEIYAIMKTAKKPQKAYAKERKGFIKKYKSLNVDRNSTMEQHQALLNDFREARTEIGDFSIDKEIAMKKLTTKEEWENIMNAVMEKTDKGKAQKSMEKTSQKYFEKLAETFTTNISDEANRKKALASIDKLKKEVFVSIPTVSDLSYKNMEALRGYNATKDDYNKSAEGLRTMRKEINDDFVKLRFELLDYATEEEWKTIIKAYNKIVGEAGIS